MKTLRLVLVTFALSASVLLAQKHRDPLTQPEIDKIRDTSWEPKLRLPLSSAARPSAPRPRPNVGRPAVTVQEPLCKRCGHGESQHPVRYACDKYPHPDPLQLCGCESDHLEDVCSSCGHKARSHKARHRCRDRACKCWAFQS